jgi:probable O-glycosylation ligase (exosortase A-associated)
MRANLVLMIVAVGILFGLRSRFAALLLYLWFALFRPQEWAWGGIDHLRLSLVAGLVLLVPALLTGVWPVVAHPLSLGSLALLFAALIAQVGAMDSSAGWAALDPFAVAIVVSLLMIRLIDTRERFLVVATVMAGSIGFYAAKFGVGFILRTGVPNLDGIGGAFGGNNEVGIAFARALPLMVAVAQNAVRPIVFWGSLSAIPLSAIGVISTYSRGSFLALVASAAVFASLQKHRVLTWSVLGVAAVIALLTVPLPDSFFERIRTIRTYEQVDDNSALGRLHFWRVALSMAGDHPLGVGLKNYQANFNRYDSSYGAFGSDRDVHNTHLQALVETGYFGFVCYVGLLWMSVALLLRIRERAAHSALTPVESRFATTMANALLASTAAFFVGGTFNSLLINELNFYSFALVAALDRLTRQMIAARAITGKRHASAA